MPPFDPNTYGKEEKPFDPSTYGKEKEQQEQPADLGGMPPTTAPPPAWMTDIPRETYEAGKHAIKSVIGALNPFSARRQADIEARQREGWAGLAHEPGRILRAGKEFAGAPLNVAGVPFTPISTVGGHAISAVTPVPYEEAKGIVNTALMGLGPRRAGAPINPRRPVSGGWAPAPLPASPVQPGVTLSEGQATGDLAAIQREQAALRGPAASGEEAYQQAQAFDAQQRAQIELERERIAGNLDPTFEQFGEVATTPQDAGALVSRGVTGARDVARTGVQEAYEAAKAMPGEVHAGVFENAGQRIKGDLSLRDEPIIVDDKLTPHAAAMLDYLDGQVANLRIQNKADPFGAPDPTRITGVNLTGVDQWRKNLVAFRRQAFESRNTSDARAAREVVRAFDRMVDSAMDRGLFTGDAGALDAFRRARSLHSEYAEMFTGRKGNPVGQAVEKILGRDQIPPAAADAVLDMLYGAAGQKPTAVNLETMRRVRGILGEGSPEWSAAKQALWQRLVERAEGATEMGRAAAQNRLAEFLNGRGRDLANTIYAPHERAMMRDYMTLMEQLRVPQAGAQWSNNYPLLNALNKAGGMAGSMVGLYLGHKLGLPYLIGEAAGVATAHGVSKIPSLVRMSREQQAARQIRQQMPLVADQARAYEAALRAARRRNAPPSAGAALTIASNNLVRVLEHAFPSGLLGQARAVGDTQDQQNQPPPVSGQAKGGKVVKKHFQFAHGGHVKRLQLSVHYRQDRGTKAEHCGNCSMFVPPHGCTEVKGRILPRGKCDLWEAKKKLQEGGVVDLPEVVVTPHETKLTPEEEINFQAWKHHHAPHDSGMDYDLRGAFKAGLMPDPETGHWPDTYKKPNHPTFSDQSIYARERPGMAGRWEGEQYLPPHIAAAAAQPTTPPSSFNAALGMPTVPAPIVPPRPNVAPDLGEIPEGATEQERRDIAAKRMLQPRFWAEQAFPHIVEGLLDWMKGPGKARYGEMPPEEQVQWAAGTALGMLGMGAGRAASPMGHGEVELGVAGGRRAPPKPSPAAERMVTLYHGTPAAEQIKRAGRIEAPVYLSSRKSSAEQYGDVIPVQVPKSALKIDADLPGGKLLSIKEANDYFGNKGWTIDDYLASDRYSFAAPNDVALREPLMTPEMLARQQAARERAAGATEETYQRERDKPILDAIARQYPQKAPGIEGLLNPLPIPDKHVAAMGRKSKRGPDVGASGNPAIELPATKTIPNIHVGNVDFDQWLGRTETILSPEEIQQARRWYRDALPVYEQYFGKEKAPAMLGAWLTANVHATPSFAQLSAVRTLEQYLNKTGEFSPQKKGGLAHEKLMEYWDAILSGNLHNLKAEGSGQKIYDFIDSALGKNTRTFYGDNPAAGKPAVADVHSLRDMGFVDEPLLNWIKKNYGEDVAAKIQMDMKGLSPGEAQYEWAADKMRRFTDELNRRGYMGGNWEPYELQAVGWTAMSKLLGGKAEMPSGAIEANIRNLSYELDFGAGAPYHKKFRDWGNLTGDQKEAVSKTILPHIVDFAKEITGAHEFQRPFGLGGWHEVTNPSYKSRLIASPEVAGDVADIIGYLAQQTEIFGYKWENAGNKPGIALYGPDFADKTKVANLWTSLIERHPDFAAGFSPSIRPDGIPGIEIILDKGGEKMLQRVQQEMVPAIKDIGTIHGFSRIEVEDFRSREASRGHDWEADPRGGSYLQRLSARYGPSIRRRLELFKREKLEPALREAIQGARQGPQGRAKGGKVAHRIMYPARHG
jgi:hypothetical protein